MRAADCPAELSIADDRQRSVPSVVASSSVLSVWTRLAVSEVGSILIVTGPL